jgi:hypothetical protein
MARNDHRTPFDPHRDLKLDYALVATGVLAALIALAYLILT